MAVLQLSIILYYDTLKILKSGLDKGPIITFFSYIVALLEHKTIIYFIGILYLGNARC